MHRYFSVLSASLRLVISSNVTPSGSAVQEGEEQAPQETVENAEEIWDILCQRPSAPLLELVINYHDFAQTVENMFALSFLVRSARSARDAPVFWLLWPRPALQMPSGRQAMPNCARSAIASPEKKCWK